MSGISKLPYAFVDLYRSRRGISMDMSLIRERMEELGIDLATLTRRYCEIRRSKGDESATPVNRRNMLAKAISDQGNPTLETFMDILAALDGKVLIEWKSTKVKEFGGDNAA
jgi:DNA-binding phage protein